MVHLKSLPLEFLDLTGCMITDAGLTHLSSLPLLNLNLSHCKDITEAGVRRHLANVPMGTTRRICLPDRNELNFT